MRAILSFAVILSITLLDFETNAQSILGTWKTVDDEDDIVKSHIQIYKENELVYGKVVKLIYTDEGTHCLDCPGERKGAPIEGMIVMEGMLGDQKKSKGGKILDPTNGKIYNCSIELVEDDVLKVRGYIGVPMLGRTQYWYRLKKQ